MFQRGLLSYIQLNTMSTMARRDRQMSVLLKTNYLCAFYDSLKCADYLMYFIIVFMIFLPDSELYINMYLKRIFVETMKVVCLWKFSRKSYGIASSPCLKVIFWNVAPSTKLLSLTCVAFF